MSICLVGTQNEWVGLSRKPEAAECTAELLEAGREGQLMAQRDLFLQDYEMPRVV